MHARITRRALLASDKEITNPTSSSLPATPTKANAKRLSIPASSGRQAKNSSMKLEKALPTPSPISIKTPPKQASPVDIQVDGGKEANEISEPSSSAAAKKRKRFVKEEDDDACVELPHNMTDAPELKEELEDTALETTASSKKSGKRASGKKAKTDNSAKNAAQAAKEEKDAERSVAQLARVKAKYAEDAAKREKAMESGKKTKCETYGLCEGQTPFPRWQHPTPGECRKVHDILSKHHPECKPQPKTVPEPSKFVAGCGEVRSILDALVRTRLSASTTNRNSSTAYQGIVKRYGTLKSGVGKGGVDYNAVRKAPIQDLFYAIKGGGLAVHKSADIMALLDIVYEENQARRKELLEAKTTKKSKGPKGADVENERQKAAEIKLAEDENLSLDHYYTLPTYEAIYKFMTFPGIGVKTAACVAMFCMQRPCFAVDTHVFRLAKWLGWVPPAEEKQKGDRPVDRDTTFSHLEVRVPDDLKYMLHQLLIKHGKVCPRCRGNTGEASSGWAEGCVIDRLVQRTGPRKGGSDSPAKAKLASGSAKTSKYVAESNDEDEEDMPDLHDEDEVELSDDGSFSDEDHTCAKKPAAASKMPARSARSARTTSSQDTKPAAGFKAHAQSSRKSTTAKPRKRKTPPMNAWRGGRQLSSSQEASTDA